MLLLTWQHWGDDITIPIFVLIDNYWNVLANTAAADAVSCWLTGVSAAMLTDYMICLYKIYVR